MAIFETKKPGRIPDGVTPVLINGTTVLDFDFDPFDNSRIAASCDDGTIRIWIIPEEGLTRPGMTQRARIFKKVQAKKIVKSNKSFHKKNFFIKFHFLRFQKRPKITL